MNKERLVSILFVSVLVLTLCVGCAQSPQIEQVVANEAAPIQASAPEEPAAPVVQGEVTKLEMLSFIEQHLDFFEKMAGIWNEQHPDRQIELVTTFLDWSAMHDKLYTTMMAGEGVPDIADVEISRWPQFMTGDIQFLDLTNYTAPYADNLVESRLEVYSKDGVQYGAPSHIGATVMYYNIELLEAAGIDYKTIVTWDDFEKALRAYRDATGNYMTYAETYGSYWFTVLLTQQGKDLIDDQGMPQLNTPEALKAAQLIRKWVDEDLIGYIPTGNADTPEGKAAVANGDVAALAYPLWYMSRFTDEMENLSGKIAIAKLPVWDENSYKSVGLGGTGTTVYKNSEHAALAAEFVTWAKLSEEGSTGLWTDIGFDPVNKLVGQNLAVTRDPGNKFLSYFVTNPFDVLAEIQDGMFTAKTMQNTQIINDYLSANTWNRIHVSLEDPAMVLDETQAELMSQANP
jgi:arabinosaccharide transport system substrate-binding protein